VGQAIDRELAQWRVDAGLLIEGEELAQRSGAVGRHRLHSMPSRASVKLCPVGTERANRAAPSRRTRRRNCHGRHFVKKQGESGRRTESGAPMNADVNADVNAETQAMPARESMEFDVAIVGAGPAGLAAAIRLKQLSPGTSVVV